MTLTITNIYYTCNPPNPVEAAKESQKTKILIDTVLFAVLATVGLLMLIGKIELNFLKVETQIYLSIGLMGAAVLLPLAAMISSCARMILTKDLEMDQVLAANMSKEEKIRLCREIIQNTHAPTLDENETKAQRRIPYHPIMGGLDLGRNSALLQATSLLESIELETITFETKTYEGKNPRKYQTVITVCPTNDAFAEFSRIKGLVEDTEEKNTLKIQNQFNQNKIEWFYVGKSIEDSADSWQTFVSSCTFLSKESKKSLDSEDKTEWFEPIFEQMDQAVFEGKSTLVHCQAGVSRSATLVAAYLINRFGVTSQEALTFLRSKRPCVDSKFESKLDAYAKSLNTLQ